ncbi:DUF397 domain-containing protein [Streptomyces sp. NPDC091377]|uniref:DUF397 domain-containing protein n=1 Tax=Streptomyces sp. NPDC091377 TaxID=3365995 RepID=UPI0037F1DDCE
MIHSPSAGNTDPMWFKSSYSDTSNPNDCVEVARTLTAIHVRDSKQTDGPRLRLVPTAWAVFVSYARN